MLQRYLLPQKKTLFILAFLLLISIVLQLINPQIIRYFIDTATMKQDLSPLAFAAIIFIGFALIQQVVSVVATYFSENLGWLTTNRLRGDLAEHCLSLDMTFHKSYTTGALIERVDGDVNALANFFSSFIIHLITNLLLLIGIIVLLFRESVIIGTGMLIFVILAIFVIRYIRRFAVPIWGKWRQVNAEFYGLIGEHLEGTEDTRANGATGYVMYRFYSMLRKMLSLRTRAFLGFAAMWITSIIVFVLGNVMAFAFCAYLWFQSEITIGTVYLVFFYTELMVKPVEQIRTQLEDLQRADASLGRIRELFQTQSQIIDGERSSLPRGPLTVELDEVIFKYEETVTIDDLQLTLAKGKVLGLLGRTGSGKTTLARLLLRFYDPQEGVIRLGGVDIRDCKLGDLRRRVAMVTQNIEIFHGTVRDNLTFYDETIPDTKMIAVLHDLGLGNWYAALPAGLDTLLPAGGGNLSAGEAQLLAFTRVFLTDPGLIILDEASSRLDPATEQQIERAIDKLLADRTCIMIAHRLATVQRADEIVILEEGRIVEHGERERLAADPHSRFSRMLSTGLEEVTV